MKTRRCLIFCLAVFAAALFEAGCGGGGGSSSPAAALFTRQLGTAANDIGQGVAVDRQGNIYVTGETAGNLDNQANHGATDIFLVKYDALGNRKYTKLLGTATEDFSPRVAVDNAGNVYVAGITFGTLDNAAASPGNGDLFVARLSPDDGATVWVRQVGGTAGAGLTPSVESFPAIAVAADGNLYVSVNTTGLLDNAVKSGTGPADGMTTDFALLKFDPSGNRLWTRQHGTAGEESASGISAAPGGGVYVGGDTTGILDNTTVSPGAGTSLDIFAAKFTSTGDLEWIRQRGSAGDDVALQAAADGSGNVYVVGYSDGGMDNNVNFGPSLFTLDAVLLKFDGAGNWVYTKQAGTPDDDLAFDVAADNAGNVYVAGSTVGNLAGTNHGFADVFLSRYDASGNASFVRQFGTAFEEAPSGVALGPGGSIFLTGFTFGGLDGNFNADPSEQTADLFVAKFDPNGVRQ